MSISAGLPMSEFDLRAVENGRRPKAWSEALNDFFDCDISFPGDFDSGVLREATASGIRVATIRSDPMLVHREGGHIARNANDVYCVLFPLDSEIRYSQRGRTVSVKDRDFAFVNIGEVCEYRQYHQTSIQLFHVPGSMLRDRIPDADDGVAQSFAHIGTHGIFLESAKAFCANASRLSSHELTRVTENLIDLMALVLLGADISCGESSVLSAHRRRALRLIEEHFANPTFDVQHLVAMMGFSERYLQRIFAGGDETCSDVLRNRRIREAQRLLETRASSGMMISQVGYAVGFSDPAHFSRVFRSLTGCAPRDYGMN